MGEPRIFRIVETVYWDDVPEGTRTFLVDEKKWDEAMNDPEARFSHECSYVDHIVNAAKRGASYVTTNRKYSFSDTPSWWDFLTPSEGSNKPVQTIDVQIAFYRLT